jgi:hypothetical protein
MLRTFRRVTVALARVSFLAVALAVGIAPQAAQAAVASAASGTASTAAISSISAATTASATCVEKTRNDQFIDSLQYQITIAENTCYRTMEGVIECRARGGGTVWGYGSPSHSVGTPSTGTCTVYSGHWSAVWAGWRYYTGSQWVYVKLWPL